jgi:DNA-binding response OmpR family regulator
MPMRVLVVEDHAETRGMIEAVLREAGYAAVPAGTLAEARSQMARGGVDAVVLDWMLPDGSGPDLCAELRTAGDATPILMLTARAGVDDRVVGLDAGADDYVKKPFAAAELAARVRALLRRGPRLIASRVMLGPIEIDAAARLVIADGKELPLTAREFDILEVLARHRGRIVTRSNLLIAVWGEDVNSSESLDVLLTRLRRKLAEAGAPDIVRTHRGVGYSVGTTA